MFFAAIAHDRAGTRGGARDATSDLGHAPRRSSRLPSLGLSRSRRPAGLAPWGAGLGACGVEGGRKGSRGQSQSRWWSAVLATATWGGFRGARFPIAGRTPPPAGNARAAVDAGSLTFFFVPFLATVSNFSTAGSGVTGGCRSARVGARSARAGGARVRSIPRHLVFRLAWKARRRTNNRAGSERSTHCQSGRSSPRPCRRRTS